MGVIGGDDGEELEVEGDTFLLMSGGRWGTDGDNAEAEMEGNNASTNIKRLNSACNRTCLQFLGEEELLLEGEVEVDKGRVLLGTTNNNKEEGEGARKAIDNQQTDNLWGKHDQRLNKQQQYNQRSLTEGLAQLGEFTVFILLLGGVLGLMGQGLRDWYLRTTENSQDAIYPVLRTLRFTSLAFLRNFPNAPELYEEACLFHNPFYEMTDVSCWPCENIRTVVDLTGFSNFTSSGYYQSGIPFIVKDAQDKKVTFEDIYRLLKNEGLGDNLITAPILHSTEGSAVDSFEKVVRWTRKRNLKDKGLRATWKVNRALYARMMRNLFQRPYYVPPETEVAVQHFLFVGQSNVESYTLPITEFANVFLVQGEGPRLIVLKPVRHCLPVCKPIRVLLQPRDVLYYNWLFWRPVMSPITSPQMVNQSSSLSITYMGSFY